MSVEDGIPEGGQATEPTHDWEKDYKALQAEYTRSQQALKDADVWEDEQAALARLAEKHPHLFEGEDDDTEDEPFEEDEADDPRIAELAAKNAKLEAWQQQVEAERGETRFNRDLNTELGDREITDRQRAWIKDKTISLGNDPKALKKAVEDFAELEKELTSAHLERVTTSKRTRHVPAGGQAGTKVPDLDNRREREDYMRQRAAEIAAANQR